MILFGPPPFAPEERRRNEFKTSAKYRYMNQNVVRVAAEGSELGQVRSRGPPSSRASFHHQLVDRFPFGVDGSLQFPRLAHRLVPGRTELVAVTVRQWSSEHTVQTATP